MQNRETRWRTPRKRGQRHSSLHVSRRQPKTKISSLRRTRGNRTRKRSSRSTRLKARAKGEADRKSAPQELELETNWGTSIRAREQDRVVKNMAKRAELRTGRETSLTIRVREQAWPVK